MERIRSLTGTRVLGLTAALAAVALGGAGCQSAARTRAGMMKAVGLNRPTPVTQFMCVVEPTPQQLPDITRNGTPSPALLGKAFLFGPDSKPADADGQLTVVMTDATPRPPGTPPRNVEVTNFDAGTMKKLLANDERLGRHYLFPIPWPADWTDVTQVIVQAQYKPNAESKLPVLYHPAVKVSIGQGPLQVTDKLTGQPAGGPMAAGLGNGVPDPDRLREQILAGGKPPVTGTSGVVPTGAAFTQPPPAVLLPPTTTVGPNGQRTTTAAWVGPPPTLGLPPQGPAAPPGAGGTLIWPPPGGTGGAVQTDDLLRPVVIPRQ